MGKVRNVGKTIIMGTAFAVAMSGTPKEAMGQGKDSKRAEIAFMQKNVASRVVTGREARAFVHEIMKQNNVLGSVCKYAGDFGFDTSNIIDVVDLTNDNSDRVVKFKSLDSAFYVAMDCCGRFAVQGDVEGRPRLVMGTYYQQPDGKVHISNEISEAATRRAIIDNYAKQNQMVTETDFQLTSRGGVYHKGILPLLEAGMRIANEIETNHAMAKQPLKSEIHFYQAEKQVRR